MVSEAAGGLRLQGLRHGFVAGRDVVAVDDLALPAGASLGLRGPSGSGKTTLLHLLAAIDRPRAGSISWGGTDVAGLGPAAADRWRRETIGLVFQDFHLAPGLSALDNVLLPWRFDHWRLPRGARDDGLRLLARVGLVEPSARIERFSRGERQRVAVARALVRRPAVLIADEPTASLDAATAAGVVDLLFEIAADRGTTLIVASHDPAVVARAGRVLDLGGAT